MRDFAALQTATRAISLLEACRLLTTVAPEPDKTRLPLTGNRRPLSGQEGQHGEGVLAIEVVDRAHGLLVELKAGEPGQSREERSLALLVDNCWSVAEKLLATVAKANPSDNQKTLLDLRSELSDVLWREESLLLIAKRAAEITEWIRDVTSNQDSTILSQLRSLIKDAEAVASVRSRELTALEDAILSLAGKPRPAEKKKPKRRHIATSTYDSDSDSSVGESPRRIRFKSKAKGKARATNVPASPAVALEQSLVRLLAIGSKFDALLDLAATVPMEVRLLRHLFYESIDSREDSIHDAASGTFRWMLEDSLETDVLPHMAATKNTFISWLHSGNRAFHISGNAGAGKSTLMKLLSHHPRTKTELATWVGEKKLVFMSFYFWNSGTTMQMSLEGLYRSILLEVCRQCPDMLPQLFPTEWTALQSSVEGNRSHSIVFDLNTTQAAFQRLLAMDDHPTHRMCFFIDGLDEYTSESVDYGALARTLRDWGTKPHIKVCVSARPYSEFLETFNPSLTLHLHELTAQDIAAYVDQSLDESVAKAVFVNEAPRIIETVVKKSQGVFVWPRVVVRSLVNMASRGASIERILQTLDAYPTEIEGLYDMMLDSLSPEEQLQSKQMLLLTAQNPFAQPVNALWLSWLNEVGNPTFPAIGQPYSAARIKQRQENVREDLAWVTKGLLEMYADRRERKDGDQFYRERIQFFHRTARDYLHDPERSGNFYRSIHAPNLVEMYSGLRLAEIVLAGKYRSAPGADPRRRRLYFNYARTLFGLRDTEGNRYQLPRRYLDLLGQDLDSTRVKLHGAYAVSCYKAVANLDRTDEDPESPADFLYFVASYGQSDYVIGRLCDGSEQRTGNLALSLLLSAAFGPRSFSLEAFAALISHCPSPLEDIKLRPAFLNDPLATVSVRVSGLLTFVAVLAFKYLGAQAQHGSRGVKASVAKQASEHFAMLDLMLDAARGQGHELEFLCVLQHKNDDHGGARRTSVTSIEEVAYMCRLDKAPVSDKVDTDDPTPADLRIPPWAPSRLSKMEGELAFVTHEQLRDYCCTAVISATEKMAVEDGLFFQIY